MTNYEFGTVVLVHFPQSGTAVKKQRPGIVVLDIGDADLVVAPVTSKHRQQAGDVPPDQSLGDWSNPALVGAPGEGRRTAEV
jgi:hypothetical protein